MNNLDEAENTWVVIPAYNEALSIRDVISGLLELFANIVVVDDGSTDNTRKIALEAGAKVISHCTNLGQGAALQTGIDFVLIQGAQNIITFDADGQHRPDDAKKMLSHLRADGSSVALGNRFMENPGSIPSSRRILLRCAILYTRWTTGLDLSDTHNGLRVLSREAAQAIKLRQNGMAHASEILSQIAEKNISFCEVPITIGYTSYSITKGQSNTASLRILADLVLEKIFR